MTVAIVARTETPAQPSGEAGALVALLTQVAGGDRSALEALYRRTARKLYGVTLRILRSEADAEEVVQDVYVAIWNKAGSYDPGKGSAITWLAVLARNRAIDRLRRKRLPSAGLDAATDVADPSPSALDLVLSTERRERLQACLGELDERQRALIRTAFLDGITYDALAQRENVPLGTMKSWIRRGLLKLRGCLDR